MYIHRSLLVSTAAPYGPKVPPQLISGMAMVSSTTPVAPSTRYTKMPGEPSHGQAAPLVPLAAAVQIFWSSYSQVFSLYTPDVQATGLWLVASGKAVNHATHSSMSKGRRSALPVEVSILPLPFSG